MGVDKTHPGAAAPARTEGGLASAAVRAGIVWVSMTAAETLHGVLRALLLSPRVGDVRARQIGVFTGALILLTVAYAFAPWLNGRTLRRLLGVGLLWVALTVAFEMVLGRLVFGFSWDRIASEYLPWRGGLMSFGMVFLAACPVIAARLRRVPPFRAAR